MAPVANTRVLFNKHIDKGYPVPGETVITDNSSKIDLDTVALNGGFLVKMLAISVDPYLRNKMNSPEPGWSANFRVGEPIYNYAVAKVLRSEHAEYIAGDHITALLHFAEYQVVTKDHAGFMRKLPKGLGVPWSAYLGVAGMPGRTAWYGWQEMCDAKKGETIYVSTTAGAVGSVVVQLAKLAGLKVIGSAGHKDKVDFLVEIGADVAFNYKETNISSVLKEHGPVDIYWDHVGGEALDQVLTHMNTFGRILVVGLISGYNSPLPPITNLQNVLFKRLRVQGLYVDDYDHKYADEFYQEVPPLVKDGKLKYTETIVRSLEDAGQLILDVQKGNNSGKAVIVLDEDTD